jgi:hypothetical protein
MCHDEEAALQICCFSIYILCKLFMDQLTEVQLKHWLCCTMRLNPSLTNYVMDQNEKQLFDLAFSCIHFFTDGCDKVSSCWSHQYGSASWTVQQLHLDFLFKEIIKIQG